ncbi:ATP-dependent Clp protease proteolytic subunit [Nocardia sp. NPDC059239]|uniref:ATP-dependent Clp protease proteolytic subunit n=1 Tax=unclassified Nocardia TaxID=2637762 RepID=UPI00369011E1
MRIETSTPTSQWQPWPSEFPNYYPAKREQPQPVPVPPPSTQVWIDPRPDGPAEALLMQRTVIARGHLDAAAATELCARLLTLDAESARPIRLEMYGLEADLLDASTVTDVLDVLRAPVSAYVSGTLGGAALGVLASCEHRYAYRSAQFVLREPSVRLEGGLSRVEPRLEHARAMFDTLLARLAELTGRDTDQIRQDLEQQRTLTTPAAVEYGLIEGPATRE